MSDVPAKTSMRPSGLTLIQACDGSPFWFIPVGYSIAANPRPVLTAISGPPGFRAGRRGAPGGGRRCAGHGVIALYSGVSSWPTASAIARIVGTVDGSVYDDLVRRGVADPVRVLEPQLEWVDPELERDPAQVRLGRERDRGDAEAAHRGRRGAVRVDDVPVELEVRDRVRARVVEAVLRQAVRREARVRARVVQRQHLAAEDPAVLRHRVGDLHVPRRPRRGAEELLLARPPPLHRLARLLREQRAHRLGRRVDLAAEAAADRAADDLELVQRQLQVRGDDAHREVERLGAGVDREPAVRLGHDLADLRLDRRVLDRGRAVDALDDQVGLVERLLDVALADLAPVHLVLEVRVPVALGMDLRGVRVEGLADVEERRALVEVGRDRRDCRHAPPPRSAPPRSRSAGRGSAPRPSRAAARRRESRAPRDGRTRATARPPT